MRGPFASRMPAVATRVLGRESTDFGGELTGFGRRVHKSCASSGMKRGRG